MPNRPKHPKNPIKILIFPILTIQSLHLLQDPAKILQQIH